MKISRVVAVALVLLLALIGCDQQAAAPTATGAPAASAATKVPATAATSAPAAPTSAPKTIKVGIQVIMSGPNAVAGATQEHWYRMALDDINAKGGVKIGNQTYLFQAVTADDMYTSEGGVQAANQLALSEKVKFVFGGATASSASAQVVYEQNQVLQLAYVVLDANLGPAHPYTFQVGFVPSRLRYDTMYQWLATAHPEAKRVSIVATNDASGQQIKQLVTDYAAARGISIVSTELLPIDTKELDPIATRLIGQNPDAIDTASLSASPALFVPLTKALSAQGFHKQLFGYGTSLQVVTAAGPAAEGFVFNTLSDWNVPAVPEAEKAIIREYIATYGEAQLQLVNEPSYVVPIVLAQAMEKAGTVDDTAKIASVLRGGEFDTIWGKMRFVGEKTYGAAVTLEAPLYFSKYEGGKFVTFDSIKASLP